MEEAGIACQPEFAGTGGNVSLGTGDSAWVLSRQNLLPSDGI